jgi:hypothetical protein
LPLIKRDLHVVLLEESWAQVQSGELNCHVRPGFDDKDGFEMMLGLHSSVQVTTGVAAALVVEVDVDEVGVGVAQTWFRVAT